MQYIKHCRVRLLSNYNIKYICTIYTRLDTCLMSISRFSLRDKVTLRLLNLHFYGADVQTWPTYIMWQGNSTYRSSHWKGRRFDSNISAIDLIIWKGRRLRVPLNRTQIWDNDVSWCRFEVWTSIWVHHAAPTYLRGV